MRYPNIKALACAIILFLSLPALAQFEIQTVTNAQLLAERLVGSGVIVSNATLTNSPIPATGFFKKIGNINLDIDSGVVLCNGRVQSADGEYGIDGDGTDWASTVLADNDLQLPGDADLAAELGISPGQLNDAIVLEFDIVPLGDSIKFNYIMSSEEYSTSTVCVYNDAFALFISGPGIAGNVNLARIPGTNIPVSIKEVNNIVSGGCINYPQFYVDNTNSVFFTHNGHTTLFTALAAVQPCQRYHLKFVVADHDDHLWDTGIFIEAKSLSSATVKIDNKTAMDNGVPFLAEGCTTGGFNIVRNRKLPVPLTVNLSFGGDASNGDDVPLVQASYEIPANDSIVFVPLSAIADNIAEPNEKLRVYVSAGCISSDFFSDSIEIEIRDYDTLSLFPADSAGYCFNIAMQLSASVGYSNYEWIGTGLAVTNIRTVMAVPVADRETYYCTASVGSCIAKDSVLLVRKKISLPEKKDIICNGSVAGKAVAAGGWLWNSPAEFSINNGTWQADSSFTGLGKNTYMVKIKDATGCIDSIAVNILQLFPDLQITNIAMTQAGCTETGLGSLAVAATGGDDNYTYSSGNNIFQTAAVFSLPAGNYNVTVKDGNQCTVAQNVNLTANNTLNIDAGPDKYICESDSCLIEAVADGNIFTWWPAKDLSVSNQLSTTAHPAITMKYYLTARLGVCSVTDSVTVFVYPAPKANAGADATVCYEGKQQLKGSGGSEFTWLPADMLSTSNQSSSPATIALTKPVNIFLLQVKDDKGCASLQFDTVLVYTRRPAALFVGRDTVVAMNEPIPLRVIDINNTGFTSFVWEPSYGLNDPLAYNPVAKVNKDMLYKVTASTPENCIASATIKITPYRGPEIYVPTAFTPNGDRNNDYLKPFVVGIKQFDLFVIYNRWGKAVYQSSNPDALGWDGYFKGAPQDTGAYVWVVKAISYTGEVLERRGSFLLIR